MTILWKFIWINRCSWRLL